MNDEKQKIQIFGQRCSGTTYLEHLLNSNFENIKIGNYYGFKHLWNSNILRPILPNKKVKIVIIVRDPYEWLRSVHIEPHHCPQLLGLSFDEFVKAEWKAYSSPEWNNRDRLIRFASMKENLLFERYENVLECRNSKIKKFIQIHSDFDDVILIKYEELRDNTRETLLRISSFLEREMKSDFNHVDLYKNSGKKYTPKKYVRLSRKSVNHINEKIDWKNEEYLGYKRKFKIDGAYFNRYRIEFLIKQWYSENIHRYLQ